MVNLYFWGDDWDLFLKVQHPELSIWGTSSGPFGTGPYRYFHTVFLVLYPFFGLNATAYFSFGILLYMMAALCVYFLVLELGRKKHLAIGVSLIFASAGYIGFQAFAHLQHLYAMLGTIIFTSLSMWALARHFRTDKIFWYVLSILLFSGTVEFYILRAHGMIFVVIFLTLLFAPWKKDIKSMLFTVLKLIPFIFIYNHIYRTIYAGNNTSFESFLSVFSNKEAFGYLINFPGTFSNIIIPDSLTKTIYQFINDHFHILKPEVFLVVVFSLLEVWITRKEKTRLIIYLFIIGVNVIFLFFSRWAISRPLLWSYDNFSNFTAILGEELLLTILLVVKITKKNRSRESGLLSFGILWFFAQYFGYFIASPAYSFLGSVHRYVAPSLVTTAIIWGTILSLSKLKKLNIVAFLGIIAIFVYLVNTELTVTVNTVSLPTKKLYSDIRKTLPDLPKNPIIFLDYENDPRIVGIAGNAYPNTGFAIFYGMSDRAHMVSSLSDLLVLLKEKKASIDNIVSFYISSKRAINTTDIVQGLLLNSSESIAIKESDWLSSSPFTISKSDMSFSTTPLTAVNNAGETVGINPTLEAELTRTSVVPTLLTLTISALPLNFNKISFPYTDVTDRIIGKVTEDELKNFTLADNSLIKLPCDKRLLALQSEKQHQEFLKIAKITTLSEFRDNKTSNLIDGKYDTDWTVNVLDWDKFHKDEIKIDLGAIKEVHRFIWVNHFSRSTPTDYSISVSTDSKTWKELKKITNGIPQGASSFVTEFLPRVQTRYVKMVVNATLANHAPSLREVWVDSIAEDVADSALTHELTDNPFYCPVASLESVNEIMTALDNRVKAKLWWVTNATRNFNVENVQEFYIIPDGVPHNYQFYLPAQGTILQGLKLSDFQVPLSITVSDSNVKSLSLKEIDELGYIPNSPKK